MNTFPPSDKEYLDPKTFECVKCGECCRPIVKVDEKDIQRIEERGLNREEFLDFDPIEDTPPHKNTLKQKNGVCMFLKRDHDQFICSIYDHRPENCRKYPFYKDALKLKDCRPQYFRKQTPIDDIL